MRNVVRKSVLTIVLTVWLVRAVRAIDPETRRRVVRQFNKHVLNPRAIWLQSRRPMYYGVLQHTGRRSGTVYVTPVVAKLTPDGVIVPLPYGADTDWCKNVLAAGTCGLTLSGEQYVLSSPEVIAAGAAEALVPPANAAIWRRLGIHAYLSMKRAAAAVTPAALAA